ncbi:MAG TPA: glycosyltransferase family 4 protein [Gaiellaceae bacterium]|nr:glycosyltransferase family 4 protein [Gaiellaceae bacterium]
MIACLRRAGVEVVERHEPVWEGDDSAWRAGAGAAARLLRAEARLLRRGPEGGFDVVLVGYPGHVDVPAARRAAGGAPVVFNPLVSLWDTFVGDRGRFGPRSLAARALLRLDRAALRGVDLVVADTEAGAAFLARLAGLPRERVASVFVGAEERLFEPPWVPREPPVFVGKLIPLHGLETILEAARRRPSLRLRVVGSGQLEHLLSTRPANVEWVPWVPYERLPALLRAAAAALGVFGRSDKAQRVIPNKAFQALACGTPLVTADTPAARELLVDGESALLVPPGDPDALAEALERVTSEPETASRLAEGGLAAYRERASEEVLGARWRTLLESL